MKALLEFAETLLRISLKLAAIMVAGFVALIAAIIWKR